METIKKITSVFLLSAFLLSGLGFTVNKMVCLKSGKTKISFFHVKNCCPDKNSAAPLVKSNCCDLTNSYFDLDDFNGAHKNYIPDAVSCIVPVWRNSLIAEIHLYKTSTFTVADLPPPLHGRALLSFISTLII